MTKKKNGRAFERLVAVIHEAYRDLPQTEIYSPYIVKDRDGDDREFDVFIITKLNNLCFQIAIECKDYNRPVAVEKVEAFNSKCGTINNINKKIMVSPKGFQRKAKKNAPKFDIELYTLEDVDKSNALSWIDVNNIRRIVLDYKILDCSLTVKDNTFGEIVLDNSIFNKSIKLESNDGTFSNLPEFIIFELDRGVRGEILLPIIEESKKRGIRNFERGFVMEQVFDMTTMSIHPVYLISSGKKNLVSGISMHLKIVVEPSSGSNNIEVKSYSDGLGTSKGELVSIKFGEDDIVNYYKSTDDNTRRVVLIKDKKITKMNLALEINEQTGKIITMNNKPR